LVIGLILGVIFTVVGSLIRLQRIPITFIQYLITGAALCYICFYFQNSWYISFLVINVYSADLILKSMKFNLLDAEIPKPDPLVYLLSLALIFQYFFEYEVQISFQIYGFVIATKLVWQLSQIFYKLKAFWVWWNLQ